LTDNRASETTERVFFTLDSSPQAAIGDYHEPIGYCIGPLWQINTNVFIAQWRISNVDIN
jgi:hypothetical protein